MARIRRTWNWLILVVHVALACFVVASGDSEEEAKTLLKFKESLSNDIALSNWNESISLCTGNVSNWKGLMCLNGAVFGLQLEGMGLRGMINIEALAKLPSLRTVSFKNNAFDGPMPQVKELGGALRGLFLSGNKFSGDIPDDAFTGMNALRRVYLENNEFTGKIPKSLAELPRLADGWLHGNQFEGEIPDFVSKELRTVNLSNNRLRGLIPDSLQNMSLSSFSGNDGLCGKPLDPCKSKKKDMAKIAIIIAAAVVAALAAIIIASFILRERRTQKKQLEQSSTKPYKELANYKQNKEYQSPGHQETYKKSESVKLDFVRNERERFDLQDLLRASAEVLGSGSFGSSYKARLLTGPTMVVKRFRHMSNVGRDEFHEYMIRLGRLSHPNLLPLVAFYYKKEEKLLITDFVKNDSLASHLHGKQNPNQPGLNWPTRLRIIRGVARGLAYLYKEFPSLTLPHGHLKSSNVLLDENFEPLLADYALVPVINKEHAQQFMVAYKSPEFTQHDRTTKKTDVWSLGILILEMLTGKFPANYLKQGKDGNADLAAWVNSVVREEWTGEVFDKDMKGRKNSEVEMLKLLKIGMCCCEWNVERRWALTVAVEKIEELKESDSDEDYSSYASEGEMYSSRAMTDEDFSFSVNG
ncbi:pollen receptor-like kinase 4 [Actinidia eriantha]|uniref:pollen receptor-like kinase 4 n=1 Tax=Actinidia eriantha TaxID=165200 RepID=UPI0025882B5D|nr:pollen receptor-like kinase 4 [Actinidia eriantha]